MGFQFRVRNLMTHEVKTLRLDDDLTLADQVMTMGRVRHLPVLDDDGKVVGILSQRDLFKGALANALGQGGQDRDQLLKTLKVEEAMATDVATVSPDDHVRVAAELMLDRKVGCLPVVDGDELVGIVSESDFVSLFTRKDD